MSCHEIQRHSSEFIDRFLDDGRRERVLEHLAVCHDCRRHVEGTREVIASLKRLPVPSIPAGLAESVMVAMDREEESAISIATRRHFKLKPHVDGGLLAHAKRLLFDIEFKLIAYSVGLFISFALFGALLASMRPMMSITPFQSTARAPIWITPAEGRVLGVARVPGLYSLPRIAGDSEVPQVASNAPMADDDNLVLIAEIAPDGRGQIVEVLSGPRDPRMVGALAIAMNRPRSFVPAYGPTGMAIPTRVVLCFERMDVLG